MTRLLTTKEVCEVYGVTREAVRLWRNNGCPYIYNGPRKLMYDENELHEFVLAKTSIKRKVVE